MATKPKGIYVAVELDQAALQASVQASVQKINNELKKIGSDAQLDEHKFTRPIMKAINSVEDLKKSLKGLSDLKDLNSAIAKSASLIHQEFVNAFTQAKAAFTNSKINLPSVVMDFSTIEAGLKKVAKASQMEFAAKSFADMAKSIGATGVEAVLLAERLGVPAEVLSRVEGKVAGSMSTMEKALLSMRDAVSKTDIFGSIGKQNSALAANATTADKARVASQGLAEEIRRLDSVMADTSAEKAKVDAIKALLDAKATSASQLMKLASAAKLTPEAMGKTFGGLGVEGVFTADKIGLSKANRNAIESAAKSVLSPVESLLVSMRNNLRQVNFGGAISEQFQQAKISSGDFRLAMAEVEKAVLSVREKMAGMEKSKVDASSLRTLYEMGSLTEEQVLKLARAAKVAKSDLAGIFESKGSDAYWIAKAAGASEEELRHLEAVAQKSMSEVERVLFRARSALTDPVGSQNGMEKRFKEISAEMKRLGEVKSAQKALIELYHSSTITSRELINMGKSLGFTREELAKTYAEANNLNGGITRLFGAFKNFSLTTNAANGLQSVLATFGAGVSLASLVELGKASMKASMEVESLSVAYKAIQEDGTKAAARLDYVRSVTQKLGLEYYSTAKHAKTFFAAAESSTIKDKADQIFTSFAQAGAALKLTQDEMGRVYLAIGQMMSKGKISAEELRQQLGEVLPGAVTMLAKAMGKTPAELDKMLQAGSVGLENLSLLANEITRKYSGAAESAAGTLQGQLNALETKWMDFKTALVTSDDAKAVISSISGLVGTAANNVDTLKSAFKALGTVGVAVFGGAMATKMIGIATNLVTATKLAGGLAAAVERVGIAASLAAAKFQPLAVGIMAGVTVGLVGLAKLISEQKGVEGATISIADAMDMVNGKATAATDAIAAGMKDATARTKEFAEVQAQAAEKAKEQAIQQVELNLKQLALANELKAANTQKGIENVKGAIYEGNVGEAEGTAYIEKQEKVLDIADSLKDKYETLSDLIRHMREGTMSVADGQEAVERLLEESKEQADAYKEITGETNNTYIMMVSLVEKVANLIGFAKQNMDNLADSASKFAQELAKAGAVDVSSLDKKLAQARLNASGDKLSRAQDKATFEALTAGKLGGKRDSESMARIVQGDNVMTVNVGGKEYLTPTDKIGHLYTGDYSHAVAKKDYDATTVKTGELARIEAANKARDDAERKASRGSSGRKEAQATYQYENYEASLKKINAEIETYTELAGIAGGKDSFSYKIKEIAITSEEAEGKLDQLIAKMRKEGRSEEEIQKMRSSQSALNSLKAQEKEKQLQIKYLDEIKKEYGAFQEAMTGYNSYEVEQVQRKYDKMERDLNEMHENALDTIKQYAEARAEIETAMGQATTDEERKQLQAQLNAIEDKYRRAKDVVDNFDAYMKGLNVSRTSEEKEASGDTSFDPNKFQKIWQKFVKSATDETEFWANQATSFIDGAADAFTNFFRSGMKNAEDLGKAFDDMISSMIAGLMKFYAQQILIGGANSLFGGMFGGGATGGGGGFFSGITSAIGGLFAANGAAFDSGGTGALSLGAYSNGVYSTPHFFTAGSPKRFANGGVFGEAGPEAIVPLARGANGRLGIESFGSGVGGGSGKSDSPVFNITVVNEGNGESTASVGSSTQNDTGGFDVELLIKSTVAKDISSGNGGLIAQSIQGTYGLKRWTRGR